MSRSLSVPAVRPPGARRPHPLEPTGWRNHLAWFSITGTGRVLLRSLFRCQLADVEPLPDGPIILAPNHRSYLDPLVVGSMIDRRVIFMMTSKYYDKRPFSAVYRMARCIVVEDEADNRRALRLGQQVLEAGRPLVVFPEGTISPDGDLKEGQQGVAWLARKTGAPVYPVFLGGTREVLRKGSWTLRLHPVVIRVGQPLRIDGYQAGRHGNARFTDDLMAAIARLGGL